MRDHEVVASIVAGDPAGLAEAYDKYARVLYSYSKTFLREPADAADVTERERRDRGWQPGPVA